MFLPIVNVDITPLVHSLLAVSYFGLVYMLSVKLIGYQPFPVIKETVETEHLAEDGTDFVESSLEEMETAQRKLNIHVGNFLNFKERTIVKSEPLTRIFSEPGLGLSQARAIPIPYLHAMNNNTQGGIYTIHMQFFHVCY